MFYGIREEAATSPEAAVRDVIKRFMSFVISIILVLLSRLNGRHWTLISWSWYDSYCLNWRVSHFHYQKERWLFTNESYWSLKFLVVKFKRQINNITHLHRRLTISREIPLARVRRSQGSAVRGTRWDSFEVSRNVDDLPNFGSLPGLLQSAFRGSRWKHVFSIKITYFFPKSIINKSYKISHVRLKWWTLNNLKWLSV